ncbi:hypothetical protein AVEN_60068-1 [Araneus ventricosus]|uniref:Mos1 transposase HTH domain-containing protein n=1 Tax=Araneus ventricosus TaxID=182803 RepID=A0A4Y2LG65_ARAVE|nr:hypothetical protein AVEN_60068-1 [Araneus ventricosus]
MSQSIENPVDCEIRSVIRFVNTRVVKATEIHRQINEMYGENIMSEGMVRKWVRAFNDVHTNVHDVKRSGRPSVISEDLEKFNRTDALRFNLYLMSFLKFQEALFMELRQKHLNDLSCSHYGQAADFYEDGSQKMVEQYDKCLNIGGNYVEM